MKEQELLHAIQNADRKYYEEAQARIHHRKENNTMRTTVIRRILSGTAVAAMLAVTAMYGAKIYRAGSDNRIVNTVPGSAAGVQTTEPGSAPDVQTEEFSGENFLGGQGRLHSSRMGKIMYDSDNWYFSPGYSAKMTADAGIRLNKTNPAGGGILAEHESYLTDSANGALYVNDTDTGAVYALDDAGSRTLLNGSAQQAVPGQSIHIQRILRLTDTKYYVDGWLFTDGWENASEFWRIIDTASGTSVRGDAEMLCFDRIYSDGDAGVYTVLWNGDAETGNFALGHITEEKTEIVMNECPRGYGWYIYDNCVYYRVPEGCEGYRDFMKYDLATGERTVLEKDCGYEQIVLCGDTVYTQMNAEQNRTEAHIVTFKPDLTDKKEMTFAYPEKIQSASAVYLIDVCGDTLVFDVLGGKKDQETLPDISSSDTAVWDPYYLLCRMDTGAMQTFTLDHGQDAGK
ncbi:MAG: hypothetical protein K6E36_09350 [Oscillospiraceae bacterium]|nr:hypothetical protein [Oscillospiraceae bacterium]